MAFRAELNDLHKIALAKLHAEIAFEAYDVSLVSPGRHSEKSPWHYATTQVMDRQKEIKKTGFRDGPVDFSFDLAILPHETGVYGRIYTERGAWQRLWMEKDFIEEFAYWDDSEPNEDIPQDEWEERGRIWDEIFDRSLNDAPSMCGFGADCTFESRWVRIDEMLTQAPTHETRVRNQARRLVRDAEFINRAGGEDGFKRLMADKKTNIFGMLIDIEAWMEKGDGAKKLAAEIDRVSKILPVEVTRDDMLADRPVPKKVLPEEHGEKWWLIF